MALTGHQSIGAQHRTLKDLACDALRGYIVDGTLEPGERLVERNLAEQLGVSRIVVREAIAQLVSEGLAVSLPRRGAQVTPLDTADVANLFDVRIALETLAARTAAQRRTDADLATLERLLAEAGEATAAGDTGAAAQLNADFHEALMAAAHNPQLTALNRSISGPARRLFRLGQEATPHEFHEQHGSLLEAIRAGDADRAARLAEVHMEAARTGTLARVSEILAG